MEYSKIDGVYELVNGGRKMEKRKRIGVFMGEVHSEYQKIVLKGISQKAKKLGYDVFVFATFGAYGDNVLYAEGERATIWLPELSAMDGIIVGDDTFDLEGMDRELRKLLRRKAKCPVVYLRNYTEGFYNVLIDDGTAMTDMTKHFVYDHGFRDICFMTGKMTMEDGKRRYEGFRRVMEEAGIPVTEHMVFHGDYWRRKGKEAVDWFMEGREDYPQAIICSNDYMALSVCNELKCRGVSIPQEVCVSGYDDLWEARKNMPSITGVGVPFEEMAQKAVEVIDNVCSKRPQEHNVWVQTRQHLRRSCGCGAQEDLEDLSVMLRTINQQDHNIKQIVFMTTDYQDTFEEEDYLRVAEKYFYNIGCQKAYLCMCDRSGEELEDEEKEDYFSERMLLKRIFSADRKTVKTEKAFDRGELLPRELLTGREPGEYILLNIHYKNKCYGYMVMEFDKESWIDPFTQAYMMSLANAIEDTAIHDEVSSMKEIRMLYQMDALTGIYNRRGFEKHLRRLLDRVKDDKTPLTIVSIDMDGLKYINDNFGHAKGDEALKRLANVLKNLTGKDDICARMGGDEFSVLLLGGEARHYEFERSFEQALEEENKKNPKPYRLQASEGACGIGGKSGLSLMASMQLADKRMYQQKREKRINERQHASQVGLS